MNHKHSKSTTIAYGPTSRAGESGITRKCKDCGKPFFISEQKESELKAKHLHLFKRCESCRKLNRKAKNY